MKQLIANMALLVKEYDEAIDFYVHKLGFELLEDTTLSDTKRWVRVRPKGATEVSLLLAKADTPSQIQHIGNQTGGRVFLFLHTDNFKEAYQNLIDHNITIVRPPEEQPYGTVTVFSDLYGNLWDLIEPKKQ